MNRRISLLNFNLDTNAANVKGALIAFFLRYRHTGAQHPLFLPKSTPEKLATIQANTIDRWLYRLKTHSLETYEHSLRVADLSVQLAKKLGIGDVVRLNHIRRGALLHDIGKIAVPQAILTKHGALTPAERSTIEQHPNTAYEWLSPVKFLHPVLDMPHYHHERWNGTGYPLRLSGEQIPLFARICAIADYWDALSNPRAYREAISKNDVIALIKQQSGTAFDPVVTNAFLPVVMAI
ncbi:MAG: HD-GYP domain-containing protein [Anaerolineae bacterium]|nr:HD-GYP domain-containing protein [Anaerolineae bacterium]